jgi:hypothetical protein
VDSSLKVVGHSLAVGGCCFCVDIDSDEQVLFSAFSPPIVGSLWQRSD